MRGSNRLGLGYGRSSVKRLMDGTPREINNTAKGIETDVVAEWVEQEVSDLGRFRKDWVEALRSRYVYQVPIKVSNQCCIT